MQRTDKINHEVRLADYTVPEYLIDSVNLTFDLDEEKTKVTSILTIRKNPDSVANSKQLILNGENLILTSIQCDSHLLDASQYVVSDDSLTINNVPDSFTLKIGTEINPKANTELLGLYQSQNNFTSHCEAEGFRRITYYLDRPDVLAVYKTKIIADEKKYPILLSNGNFISKGKTEDGRHWVEWEDPYKKPSYLYALVAGDFELLQDTYVTTSGKTISLQIFCENGYGTRLTHAMDVLKRSMRWEEDNYGREYDLDDYKIVAVSDFNMGAMENKGLNIFNAKSLLASPESATDDDYYNAEGTIAHEYFHNWTGNRVTCRDWFQLSLKEGLTSFRDQSYSEDVYSITARIDDVGFLRSKQFAEDAGPLAHPVQPTSYMEIDNFYTWTIYRKGAEIFRLMQMALGKEMFRKGMDIYFQDYDGQAVTIEHFVKAMEKAAGKDLSQFLLWFSQVGTPIVDAHDHFDQATNTYTLTLTQSFAPLLGQANRKPMVIPVKMGLLDQAGNCIPLILNEGDEAKSEMVLTLTQAQHTFHFLNVPSKPVPSLLRHFSAPVKLHYDYSDNDLRLLSTFDSDLFNRWDAMQRYVIGYILKLISRYEPNVPVKIAGEFVEVFRQLLTSDEKDPSMLALLLTIPSLDEIADHMDCVCVEAICAVRTAIVNELAKQLESLFLANYKKYDAMDNHDGKVDVAKAGIRSLKNSCLEYMVALNRESANKLARTQFDEALTTNMTNAFAAMRILMSTVGEDSLQVSEKFYNHWRDDIIVIGKWFSAQASSTLPDAINNIKALKDNEKFDIKNPNLVRALMRPFVRNLPCFHASSGEGYQFCTNLILEMNAINPNMAAEMVEYYSRWRNFTSPQSELMKNELQYILSKSGLSKNVYEIASKSLGLDNCLEAEPASQSVSSMLDNNDLIISNVPATLFVMPKSTQKQLVHSQDADEKVGCCPIL